MLRRTLAGVAAAGLVASGIFITTAATAAPESTEYVEVTTFEEPDTAGQSAVYNQWHFGPSTNPVRGGLDDVEQHVNGFTVDAGAQIQVLKGNGNDAVSSGGAAADDTSVVDLANSLEVVTSHPEDVAYQVPVFYLAEGDTVEDGYSFTTLRLRSDLGSDSWISSNAIGSDIEPNLRYDIEEIADALGDDAYPIAVGLMVDRADEDVLVSSLLAGTELTRFYTEPASVAHSGSGEAFVHSDDIRPNADSYTGWHEEVDPEDPDLGGFESIEFEDEEGVWGLVVVGKSQLIYGYAEEARPQNNLAELVEAGFAFEYEIPEGEEDSTFHTQIPVFFYQEGVIGQQFTTLRTGDVPVDGPIPADALWASSRDLGSVPANTYVPLSDILAALGNYEVLGHGFTVDRGVAVVYSVSFNGYEHVFYQVDEDDDDTGNGDDDGDGDNGDGNGGDDGTDDDATDDDDLADTGTSQSAAIAALALLAAGGGAFAVSRRRALI